MNFFRQCANKEAELAQQGKEPEVPDFKEIMDMDFALSLYHKDVAEWKSKEPNDLAAKLSRDKLYNLFPDMSQEVLSEVLMAHDNNFKATVEVSVRLNVVFICINNIFLLFEYPKSKTVLGIAYVNWKS